MFSLNRLHYSVLITVILYIFYCDSRVTEEYPTTCHDDEPPYIGPTDTYLRKNISYATVVPDFTVTTYSPWSAPNSCYLIPEKGPCRADVIRWFYRGDKVNACAEFFYGGCQGNGNNFETKLQCECTCMYGYLIRKVTVPPFCYLSFDYGYCFATFDRWFYDKIYKKCRKTLYSGCGGNPNNFKTLQQCESACVYNSKYVTRLENYYRRSMDLKCSPL